MDVSASPFPVAGRQRRNDIPTEHLARIGWMVITLLCDGVLDYGLYCDRFGMSKRQFQRDVRQIRGIGRAQNFDVSPSKSGRVFLVTTAPRIAGLSAKGRDAATTLARLAAAFGGPIAQEMRAAIGDANADRRGFLQVREPLPSADERVTARFERLKEAAAASARVEFDYIPARGAAGTRRVEPYHIVERTGRYYLVAYDLMRRAWRYFALDAIRGTIVRAGTYPPRPVPERFLADGAVGWISGSHGGEVTIRVNHSIAAAVGARTWQQGQRFETLPDGGAELTMQFGDLGEAVRFALGFGAEAVITAPAEAVELARDTAERIARSYPARLHVARTLTG